MSDNPSDPLKKTTDLAHLEIGAERAAALSGEIEAILDHFAIIASVEVEGIEPTLGIAPLEDVKRPDEPRPGLSREATLANAPDRRGDFFGVPKTIGGER
jgi:aspartyl-tRNA(Asn)/glutamyl-tRNA(Gln) amidotransferase subunit C